MEATAASLQLKGFGKQTMADLIGKAKRLGVTPEGYVLELVRQDLALDRKARTPAFDKLLGPGKVVDEAELDRLVEAARTRHHLRKQKRK